MTIEKEKMANCIALMPTIVVGKNYGSTTISLAFWRLKVDFTIDDKKYVYDK